MQATSVSHKLIKKIKDDRFDAERLDQYTLLTQLGVRDLQVAVVDPSDNNRLLFFEDYIFNGLSSYEELLDVLRTLYDSHELLTAGFWKNVIFSIKNNHLVQVPESLFIAESAGDYLMLNATSDKDKDEVLYCQHRVDAVTVFALHKDLYAWINQLYKNSAVKFIHQSAALIEGVLEYAPGVTGSPLYVYVDRFKMHILAVKNNGLVYYNQFAIKQFADYIKYIMLVMNGLGMDQKASQVILWGYIGKNSPHYQEFYKYIRNVVFGGRPGHLRFGYMFDEVQEHHFFDLYSMNLFNS